MERTKDKKSLECGAHTDKYFTSPDVISCDIGDFYLSPSEELVMELDCSVTLPSLQLFDDGASFSVYQLSYSHVGKTDAGVYKTNTSMYPGLNRFSTAVEYNMSVCKSE